MMRYQPIRQKLVLFNIYVKWLNGKRRLLLRLLVRKVHTTSWLKPADCIMDESVQIHTGEHQLETTETPADWSDQETTWRFMGDAYVHELMYGEADEMNVEERDIVQILACNPSKW
jgi:hypothetical protein